MMKSREKNVFVHSESEWKLERKLKFSWCHKPFSCLLFIITAAVAFSAFFPVSVKSSYLLGGRTFAPRSQCLISTAHSAVMWRWRTRCFVYIKVAKTDEKMRRWYGLGFLVYKHKLRRRGGELLSVDQAWSGGKASFVVTNYPRGRVVVVSIPPIYHNKPICTFPRPTQRFSTVLRLIGHFTIFPCSLQTFNVLLCLCRIDR